jgi:hypothetical protein
VGRDLKTVQVLSWVRVPASWKSSPEDCSKPPKQIEAPPPEAATLAAARRAPGLFLEEASLEFRIRIKLPPRPRRPLLSIPPARGYLTQCGAPVGPTPRRAFGWCAPPDPRVRIVWTCKPDLKCAPLHFGQPVPPGWFSSPIECTGGPSGLPPRWRRPPAFLPPSQPVVPPPPSGVPPRDRFTVEPPPSPPPLPPAEVLHCVHKVIDGEVKTAQVWSSQLAAVVAAGWTDDGPC